MPSPFPGMDPWLEGDEWEDFHATFNTVVRETLQPQLEPAYVVRVERRVYVEQMSDETLSARQPDVAILTTDAPSGGMPVAGSANAVLAPVECLLAMPEERRETYLVIRHRESMEIVTVLETLSPTNKRRSSEGFRQYQKKRLSVLQSGVHLVEIDLLRGGERMPMQSRLPVGDYYAMVSKVDRRPWCNVFAWTISDTLPTIQVPLQDGDADVPLDLQTVFATVYDRARYDLTLDYSQPPDPPFSKEEAARAAELMQ